jgi:hypothetical protein
MKVPVSGGSPVTLAPGASTSYFRNLGVGASGVYWTDYAAGRILAVPPSGGPVSTIASGQSSPAGLALDATSVYWTNNSGHGAVLKTSLGGGTPTTLASNLSEPSAIAVDATHVYWTTYGALESVPLAGGPATMLASGGENGVALDATNVYWTTNVALEKMPLAGGTPVTLAGAMSSTLGGIAVDSAHVYAPTQSAGTVLSVPIGGGSPSTLASGQEDPWDVAVDCTNVYWANRGTCGVDGGCSGGSIVKMGKP